MTDLEIVLVVDGEETILKPERRWHLMVRPADKSVIDREISIWSFDDREDGSTHDPVVYISIGEMDIDPQIVAYPINNHPNGKTGPTGLPVWWEYDL